MVIALAAGIAAVLGGTVGGLVVHRADDHTVRPAKVVSLGQQTNGASNLVRPPGSVAAVAARILPSVVSIEVRSGGSGDTGSGIVISREGYILTNNHVVSAVTSGAKLTVVLPDERRVGGTVVGRDPVSDL